jgi:hypothetical protein
MTAQATARATSAKSIAMSSAPNMTRPPRGGPVQSEDVECVSTGAMSTLSGDGALECAERGRAMTLTPFGKKVVRNSQDLWIGWGCQASSLRKSESKVCSVSGCCRCRSWRVRGMLTAMVEGR